MSQVTEEMRLESFRPYLYQVPETAHDAKFGHIKMSVCESVKLSVSLKFCDVDDISAVSAIKLVLFIPPTGQ